MKKILVVSNCSKRGTSTGLAGKFLDQLSKIDKQQFQISLLDTSFNADGAKQSLYPVHSHFTLPNSIVRILVRKIPGLRGIYGINLAIKTYKSLLKKYSFDWVVLYQVQPKADQWTKIAHQYNSKIAFVPWGSEVLRVSGKKQERLRIAFSEVDYVIGAEYANTLLSARDVYSVPEKKLIYYKNYLKGVKLISKLRDKYSREEMMSNIGIPQSEYNILCGYNGYVGQNHKTIIDAINKNRNILPKGHQLVFPITYGASVDYIEDLKNYCTQLELNSVFITEYLTDEQIAFLHLVTDLFIQIQPTDDGNDFMKEALFAQNQIVTGRWLKYFQFEQYGDPYYVIDTTEELPIMLSKIFSCEIPVPTVPSQLVEDMDSASETDNKLFWEKVFTGEL